MFGGFLFISLIHPTNLKCSDQNFVSDPRKALKQMNHRSITKTEIITILRSLANYFMP